MFVNSPEPWGAVPMTCGCTVTTVNILGNPLCHEHACSEPSADWVQPGPRMAKCCYCGKLAAGGSDLSCFEALDPATKYFDRFYCGCRGWD